MKIVQTNKAYFPVIGGMETVVTTLSEGLYNKDGVSVEVLTCNDRRSLRFLRRNVNDVPVTFVPTWGNIASLPISPAYFGTLAKLDGDILHIHEPFPLADLSMVFLRNIRRNFSRIVVSWHSDIIRQKWALALYSPVIHKLLELADCILVASAKNIESSRFLQSYKEKCEVIPFGLELAWAKNSAGRAEMVNAIRKEHGVPLLLFVGRLVYYKGLKYLVDALHMLPEARLIIIGSGPLLGDIRKQIARLNLNARIVMIPHLPRNELQAYYDACDVFVLPSTEVSEAFGLVQIEAMACGKPVVSTNLGTGVTFVNKDGITGLTVEPRDSKRLCEALRKLITNKGLRTRLGQNAQKRAFEEFSARKMVDRTYKLYQRLLTQ